MPMAAPRQGIEHNIGMYDSNRSFPNYWRRLVLVGHVRPSQNPMGAASRPSPGTGGGRAAMQVTPKIIANDFNKNV